MSPSYDNDTSSAGASERKSDADFVERMSLEWFPSDIASSDLSRLIELARRAVSPDAGGGEAVVPELFVFTYRNHRGEVGERHVRPISVRFGSTDWHPEPQWLLRAYDCDKGAEREFAMKGISAPVDAVAVVERQTIIDLRNDWQGKAFAARPEDYPKWNNHVKAADKILAALREAAR